MKDSNKTIPANFQGMHILISQLTLLMVLFVSCKENSQKVFQSNDHTHLFLKSMESREDTLEMISSLNAQKKFLNVILADVETLPVESGINEDAADDPAIWVNEKDPTKSLILGTNKTGGIYVYDMKGKALQFRKVGRINNVDLRDGFILGKKEVVLVAGSNRSNNCISLFYIDKGTGQLSDTIANIKSGVDEVYGICLYKSKASADFYVFVNGKGGQIEQWQISPDSITKAKFIREFIVSSQPEGMTSSDELGILYFGVEDAGIYKVNAEPGFANPVLIPGSDSLNPNIAFDIEGLALFSLNESNYLVASSQGNFSYAIFKLGDKEGYLSSFIIGNGVVDGAEETDGIEITTSFLGREFPKGVLVVQDGFNFDEDSLVNQNFKIVSLEKVLRLL